MTTHIRNMILGHVATLLKTSPTNWDRVFEQRIMTTRILKTYLMVYFEGEPSERLTIHDASPYRKTVQFRVDAQLRITSPETLEATIGDVAGEIETKLTNAALRALTTKAQDLNLVLTEVQLDDEQNPSSVIMAQTWNVSYIMAEGSPTV